MHQKKWWKSTAQNCDVVLMISSDNHTFFIEILVHDTVARTELFFVSGFLNNLSCGNVLLFSRVNCPSLSYTLRPSFVQCRVEVFIAYSLRALPLPHGFLTHVEEVSVRSGVLQRYFLSFQASSTINKGRVISCTRELPGKSRRRSYQSWNLYEICFCLRFCCVQSDQQVLAKCRAWFPVELCKALQDNKRFGGTE